MIYLFFFCVTTIQCLLCDSYLYYHHTYQWRTQIVYYGLNWSIGDEIQKKMLNLTKMNWKKLEYLNFGNFHIFFERQSQRGSEELVSSEFTFFTFMLYTKIITTYIANTFLNWLWLLEIWISYIVAYARQECIMSNNFICCRHLLYTRWICICI